MIDFLPTVDRTGRALPGLARHEAKFLVPWENVQAIRDFIEPFTYPDSHGEGDPPLYTSRTLQLDNPWMSLANAKEWESPMRFKLRVRTYGDDGTAPVFLEVKKKLNGVNLKSRAMIPHEMWASGDWRAKVVKQRFKADDHVWGFFEFRRLVDELGVEPLVLIRYDRESYHGRFDRYARVTLDYRIMYRRARDWNLFPTDGPWWNISTQSKMNIPFAGVVLELKSHGDAPLWMIDLVREFDLVRTGFCKYFNAVRCEHAFEGREMTDKLKYALSGIF